MGRKRRRADERVRNARPPQYGTDVGQEVHGPSVVRQREGRRPRWESACSRRRATGSGTPL